MISSWFVSFYTASGLKVRFCILKKVISPPQKAARNFSFTSGAKLIKRQSKRTSWTSKTVLTKPPFVSPEWHLLVFYLWVTEKDEHACMGFSWAYSSTLPNPPWNARSFSSQVSLWWLTGLHRSLSISVAQNPAWLCRLRSMWSLTCNLSPGSHISALKPNSFILVQFRRAQVKSEIAG